MKKVLIVFIALLFLVLIGSIVGLYFMGDKLIEEALVGDVNKIIEEDPSKLTDSSDLATNVDPSQENHPSESGSASGAKNNDLNRGAYNKKSGSDSADKAITVDKIKQINKEVPKIEKVKIATTVVKRLNTSEISELKQMSNGGFTNEEKQKAKKLIYKNFTAKEIKELKQMYSKYN